MKSMILGTIIVVVGLSVILGAVFGINIPIFKILFGLFFVYLGVKIIFGSFSVDIDAKTVASDHQAIFSKSIFTYPNRSERNEYATVFGASTLDLSDVSELIDKKIEISTVFGETLVKIRKGVPLRVRTKTLMGQTALPGKNISAMGTFDYVSPGVSSSDAALSVDTNVVFGSLKFEEVE
jgi:hypothetical protein